MGARLRQWSMWLAATLLLALAGVSIYGAFIGAEAAGEFFSSAPMAAFWCLLLVLLGLSLVYFPNLRNRPALVALHVGPLLVILGTMYGSKLSHRLRRKLGWRTGPESGYLTVREGQSGNVLRDQKLNEKVGNLPFRVKLEDFRLEQYATEDSRWNMYYVRPGTSQEDPHNADGDKEAKTAGGTGPGQQNPDSRQVRLDWKEGQTTTIPDSDLRVTVLRHIPRAKPAYDGEERAALKVMQKDGPTRTVAAEKGNEIELEDRPVTFRIERIYSNMQVEGTGKDRRIIDAEGKGKNPALKVKISGEGKEPRHAYVMPRYPMHGQAVEGVTLRYSVPEPTGARAAEDSSTPAIKVNVESGEKGEMTGWLMVEEGQEFGPLSLDEISNNSPAGTLYLARPGGPPKAYKSDVVVMEEGQPVGRKTIQVNDPLHYGGYHLYQSSYDRRNHAYTVLQVKSDDGLWMVYAGFMLLAGGAVWFCWGRPTRRYIAGRWKAEDCTQEPADTQKAGQ